MKKSAPKAFPWHVCHCEKSEILPTLDQTHGKKQTKNGVPTSAIHYHDFILSYMVIATPRTKGFDQIYVFLDNQLTLNFDFFENVDF